MGLGVGGSIAVDGETANSGALVRGIARSLCALFAQRTPSFPRTPLARPICLLSARFLQQRASGLMRACLSAGTSLNSAGLAQVGPVEAAHATALRHADQQQPHTPEPVRALGAQGGR